MTIQSDMYTLPELSSRQEQILGLIVRSFTENPEPVSSKHLVEAYSLNFSSATVRNEMATLDELGYLTAPHTSAGRVPTEQGYRYFVKRLIDNNRGLSVAEKTHISTKFHNLPLITEQWLRLAATMLSRTAQTASLVTPPVSESNRFKHLELIAIQGRLVLMVLVLHGGGVHQQMLNLAEPVPQATLSDAASRINALCLDLNAYEVRMKGVQLPVLEREIIDLATELMEKADSNQVRVIYRDGLSDVINMFEDNEGAKQAVRVFEERAFLNMILAEVLTPLFDGVHVMIAGEGRWEELSQLSMVLSRYGIPGHATGAIGVLGPTHINYGRAINSVRYISDVMTGMIENLYKETPSEADSDNALPDNDDSSLS